MVLETAGPCGVEGKRKHGQCGRHCHHADKVAFQTTAADPLFRNTSNYTITAKLDEYKRDFETVT